MNTLELITVKHDKKVGGKVGNLEPNITEDTLFTEGGKPVGFYIKNMADYSRKACKLANIADAELRSNRVPKTEMSRGPQGNKADKLKREQEGKQLVTQYSVILGGVPPKPHMRRDYPTISSVHGVASAKTFVKAMLMLAKESQEIIKAIMPEQYELQMKLIEENSPEKYRFGDLFTSSISNFNISANYHIDRANIKGCSNVIIAKRMCATGGNTTVPDYGATVDSADNSMLFYPAWRNLHGVTPILKSATGGYRNTLVFYPLGSFKKYK
tara:strand:- start:464 stop:1273 length:810 start_codon:yes stop_codon:yes gene_type:complete